MEAKSAPLTSPLSLTEKRDDSIPWYICMDIDRWHQHVANQSADEAKGSYDSYILLGNSGKVVTVSNTECDLILVICSHNGVTHITAFGEEGVTHYVGIIEDFHEVYTAIKHF